MGICVRIGPYSRGCQYHSTWHFLLFQGPLDKQLAKEGSVRSNPVRRHQIEDLETRILTLTFIQGCGSVGHALGG